MSNRKRPQQAGAKVRSRKAQQRKGAKATAMALPTIRPDTAGIDIGSMEIFVAVSPDRSDECVRSFGTFTSDLQELIKWLQECGVKSVAMESTGVYWIPLYQLLTDAGIEVCLVNARHFKNVPGRKTDVQDCQWLQYLHAVGLLRASFRPDQVICAVRTLQRHRQSLIQMASEHVLHIQKSMEQMNLKLQHVLSDITGVTGLRIIDAILAGERDAKVLASLRDGRVKADEDTIVKALTGDYRPEHLATMKQSLEGYRFYQKQIADLDEVVEGYLDALPSKVDLREHPLPVNAKKSRRQNNAPAYDARLYCYRAFGVDVTAIPGIGGLTAQVLLTEIGPDLSKFTSGSAFANWLALCPHQAITGGKVLATRTRKGSNRATIALRLAAQTLEDSENRIGQFFRRMRSKLGRAEAITAVAHRLARVFYAMVTTGTAYDDSLVGQADDRRRGRQEAKLRKQALELGFTLVATQTSAA